MSLGAYTTLKMAKTCPKIADVGHWCQFWYHIWRLFQWPKSVNLMQFFLWTSSIVPNLDLCIIMPMCPIAHLDYYAHVPHQDLCTIMPMCHITCAPSSLSPSRSMHYYGHVPHHSCPHLDLCIIMPMCPITHQDLCTIMPMCHIICAPSPMSPI